MTDDLDQVPRAIRPEPYFPPDAPPDSSIGVISLATGITGLILSFIPLIGLLSWILCPAAIITGFMSFSRPAARGLGIAGLITGILGLIMCVVWLVLIGIVFASVGSAKNF